MDNRFHAHRSLKLDEFLTALNDPKMRVKVTDDSFSSWIEVDVHGKYGWAQYAIWKATDALYILDRNGAAGDDPVAVRTAVQSIDLIPKHRGRSDDQIRRAR